MCKPVLQNTKFAAATAPFFAVKDQFLVAQPYSCGYDASQHTTSTTRYNPKQLYDFNIVPVAESDIKVDMDADQLLNLWTTVKDVNTIGPFKSFPSAVPMASVTGPVAEAPRQVSELELEDNFDFEDDDDLSPEFPELQDTDVMPLFDILLDTDVADILSEFVEEDHTTSNNVAHEGAMVAPKPKSSHHKICSFQGCTKYVRSRGLCKAHGGSLQCIIPDCGRQSQGNGLCIKHGGGRRCEVNKCNRAAQSNHRCKKHGGGQRCSVDGCYKSSQGGGLCRSHGGGQRCGQQGCGKGAQRDGYCAAHGGIRLCSEEGCTRNDRGGGHCAYHGGGKRCKVDECIKPSRKHGLCAFHFRALEGPQRPK